MGDFRSIITTFSLFLFYISILFNLYLEKKIDPVYEIIPFEKILDYLDLIGSRKTIGRIVATI